MNELEKKEPQKECSELRAADAASPVDACAETESPAEAISEAADKAEAADAVETKEACVEEESPAEDLSEMTDALQPEEQDEKANAARIHNMSKEEMVSALKEILADNRMESHKEVTAMKQAFFNIRSHERMDELNAYVEAGNSPETFAAVPDELENEFKELYTEFKEKRQAYLAADEARKEENLAKKQEVLEKMRAIATDIDTVNVKFPEFQQLQQEFLAIKDVPATAETETWKQFQTVREAFYDHLKMNKELRDLDFKKNLELKRGLIEEARKLSEVGDPVAAFRQLQALHDEWRNIGPVAKDIRETLWEEFREVSAVVNRRHQEYFEKRKASEQVNEEAKTKLCEEIEAINPAECTTFAEWNKMTDKIIDLQKQWKEYGYASKKANTALYARFRKACDNFFEAKTVFFHKMREDFNENMARKIALCERAEALKDNKDIKNPTAEIVKLQAEWKTIGSVPRKQSDEIWNRFTEACNYFFDERKRQNKERRKEEVANLEAKKAIIEQLKALPLDGDRREVMGKVKELQAAWNNAGFVPFKVKDQIFKEYREICDTLYNTYSERESRQRMNNWQERVGKMRGDGQKVLSERDKLVRALEARRNELHTIENNMGFFNVKSSEGNSMVRDMERKLARLRDEIAEIQNKIKILDTQDKAEE